MGTYDSFYFVGSASELVTCAAGHPQAGELQSKDLDCSMSSFHVFDGQLFEGFSGLSMRNNGRESVNHAVENGELVITRTSRYIPAIRIDGGIEMHTVCYQCEPVISESGRSFDGGVSESQPWCQWVAIFNKGKLVEVRKDRCESREDVKAKLGKIGCAPLPDDDRLARRALEQWRRAREISC
jgi:hypothetical protein